MTVDSDQDPGPHANREMLLVPGPVTPRPGDKLCHVCEKLQLSPRLFVVFPGDEG